MEKNFVDRWPLGSIALVCVLLVFAVASAIAAEPIPLRAAATDPEGTTVPALAIGKLCELTTKLSKGELDAKAIYQALGGDQELAVSIKAGSVDIGYGATSNLTRFTDAFMQFDLPFLFKNDKGYIDVMESHPAGKKALAQWEKDLGVKTLMILSHAYDAPVSGTDLQTRSTPVKVPADMKGLKIRTGSTPVEIALVKAYGANPTPVNYSQLYSALQQGVVDGNIATPLPPYAAIKLYEVTKYYVAIGFRINLLPIYMNQKKFDSLTAFQKGALLDAVAQTKALAHQWARDKVKTSIDEVEKAGVHIYHPTPSEMTQWLSVREKVWQQIADEFKGKVDLNIANDIFKLRQR
jgi:TRAP-type C4-dicarboxylate transport system substrate-binding protein